MQATGLPPYFILIMFQWVNKTMKQLKELKCGNWPPTSGKTSPAISIGGGVREIALNLGVFLVSAKNAFAPMKRDISVNTYLKFQLSHEGVSEVSERARERSERVKQA